MKDWEGTWGHTVEGPVAESQCPVSYSASGHTGVSYWILVMEDKVCTLLMWGKEKHLLSDYWGTFICMSHMHAFWKKVLLSPFCKWRDRGLRNSVTCTDVNSYLVQARFELESVWLYSGGFPSPSTVLPEPHLSSSSLTHYIFASVACSCALPTCDDTMVAEAPWLPSHFLNLWNITYTETYIIIYVHLRLPFFSACYQRGRTFSSL